MKKRISFVSVCALGLLVLAGMVFIGCDSDPEDIPDNTEETVTDLSDFDPLGDLDGDGILNEEDTDIDGDGLGNDIETDTYHTSPYIADTDGDGWSDSEEVTNTVAGYPPKFSPLVADLPAMYLRLRSHPDIEIEYTTTSEESVSYTIAETSSYTSSSTTSSSFTQTTASEHGWNVEAGIEFGASAGKLHMVGHVTVGSHGTYTREDSYEFSNARSIENSKAVENARENGTSESLALEGGRISVSVSFDNPSSLAYDVSDLTISAYKLNPYIGDFVEHIATLAPSASELNFTLQPESSDERIFIFENDSLTVDKVLDLLDDSTGIIFSVAGYDIDMEDRNFTQASTEVPARSCEVFIDYGPSLPDMIPERYNVAVKTDFNADFTSADNQFHPVPLSDILDRIGIPLETGTVGENDGLTSLGGISQDTEHQYFWYIVHKYSSDGHEYEHFYSINDCSYNLSDILVKTGDQIELIYSIDEDQDQLALRMERILGSSDLELDSDGDGLEDFEEVVDYHTDPGNPDTDGDGDNDLDDDNPLVPKVSSNTDIISLFLQNEEYSQSHKAWTNLYAGTTLGSADAIAQTVSAGYVIPIPYDSVYVTVDTSENVNSISISNAATAFNTTLSAGITSEEMPLKEGLYNLITVTVTATDSTTVKNYQFYMVPIVPGLSQLNASAVANSDSDISLSWEQPDSDQLHSGMFIVRNTVNDFSSVPPDYESLPITSTNTLFGYDLMINLDSNNSSTDSTMDSDLLPATTYYYAGYAWFKHDSDPTYWFSLPSVTSATTNTSPNLSVTVNLLGVLTVKDSESGDSEFYWTINLEQYNSLNQFIGRNGLGYIAGPDNPGNKLNYGDDYAAESGINEVSMEQHDYAVYDTVYDNRTLYIRSIDGYDNEPIEDLGSYADAAISDTYGFQPNGYEQVISIPQVNGNQFRITIKIWENDGGATECVNDTLTFQFAEGDAGNDNDDLFILTGGEEDLATVGSTSSHIYASNKNMNRNVQYILNPYFDDEPEGQMQVFFELVWTEQ